MIQILKGMKDIHYDNMDKFSFVTKTAPAASPNSITSLCLSP